ncbi:uncharacterized protein LOC129734823 [Falco cherrug]|uniref:uncharacterized protein LOC129734823 n=1 Tax=Falco cherrug TaxID=345164 RepID=UPI002478428D|nr:uncharacterized protein LOC129734823 [Falco cherrug]
MGHLAAAVATEDKARRELLATARALPVASELATVAEAVTSHRTRVAEASAGLKAATEATEATAVAAVGAAVASERSRRAAVAREPLGRLVAACDGATRFYRHLCCHLKDMEATVAALAAGCGGPEAHGVAQGGPGVPKATATMEDGPGVPKATVTTQVGPGVPKDLMAAVTVAEALWDASARLAKCHLLEALKVARELLTTPGVPSVTAVTSVATRCGAATSCPRRAAAPGTAVGDSGFATNMSPASVSLCPQRPPWPR